MGQVYGGVDVSKDWLDIACWPGGDSTRFPNDETGIAESAAWLRARAVCEVSFEATGGYERALQAGLVAAGLIARRENPRQVRHFAQATGQLAKTDRIDASVLAHYAAQIGRVQRTEPDDPHLAAAAARRRQLVEMITAEKNRLAAPTTDAWTRSLIQRHIEWLEEQLQAVDAEQQRIIAASPTYRERARVLESMTGVGRVLSSVLIADLPELGACSGKEITALVGLAPFSRESGAWRGRRQIWGGRAHVRTALYMPTLSAVRSNPVVRSLYRRLRSAGKPHKVAMVACMRSMLVTLNALARDGVTWSPPPLDANHSC